MGMTTNAALAKSFFQSRDALMMTSVLYEGKGAYSKENSQPAHSLMHAQT